MSIDPVALAVDLVTTLVAAVLGTGALLWVARRWRLVDEPNERSTHTEPTPTLGGVAIALAAGGGVWLVDGLPPAVTYGVWGGLAVLLVAVLDDIGQPMTVRQKLGVQVLAIAAWLLLGPPLTAVHLPGYGVFPLGRAAAPLAALWLLWLMNIYNFMDGIDGLTSMYTLVAAGTAAACLALTASALLPLPLVAAAAALGFLVFNRPPARIFMGDVGSLSLGFLVGVTALAGSEQGLPLWASLLILAPYTYDTTHTLLRRLWRRANVLRAHREHLYQRLVQSGWPPLHVDVAATALGAVFGAAAWSLVAGYRLVGVGLVAAGALVLALAAWWKERTFGA